MGKVYYKKTVAYTIGVRRYIGDAMGVVLNAYNPVVEVDEDKLRDFKLANKAAILGGMIILTEEPEIDWDTDNALTDQEITELNKSYLALKAKLIKINSLPVLYRILEDAKAQERTRKTIALIENRIEEVEEPDNFSIHPDDMQGVE